MPTPGDDEAFAQRSRRSQIARVRRVALDAVRDYPVEVAGARLAHHGHNTTFAVDTVDRRRFALRVNVNSRSSPANLEAETAWLTALAADGAVRVPAPLATVDGRFHTDRPMPDLGRPVSIVMMSWLPGRHVHPLTITTARELGRLTAALHRHAASWTVPPGATFPSHASVLLDDPNRLQDDHPLLTPAVRAVVDAALDRTQQEFDALHAQSPSHALHADLHAGNLKWDRRAAAVFDFDDAVIGPPLLDLGIATYYLPSDARLHDALLAGYDDVRPVPEFEQRRLHAVLAARNLLLLNDVIDHVTADVRAVRQRYVDNSVIKLRWYLERGEYRHDLPGVTPLGF